MSVLERKYLEMTYESYDEEYIVTCFKQVKEQIYIPIKDMQMA